MFTAQSRVRSVSDYIDTRRGSVGPEARTRFNEAVRQLEAAQTKSKTNITEAIAHANGAALLAAQAQQLANDDVQAGQRQYQARYNGGRQSDMGAMVGGIILGNILTGGMGGEAAADGRRRATADPPAAATADCWAAADASDAAAMISR